MLLVCISGVFWGACFESSVNGEPSRDVSGFFKVEPNPIGTELFQPNRPAIVTTLKTLPRRVWRENLEKHFFTSFQFEREHAQISIN